MTRQNFTRVALILDASGSMQSMKEEVERGYKNFVDDLKQTLAKDEVLEIQTVQFSSKVYPATPWQKIQDAQPLRYEIKDWTALLDAVGITIKCIGDELDEMKEEDRPSRVMLVIMTDGQENCSKEFDHASVAQMIKEQQEKYNWEFLFLVNGLGAVHEAHKLNVSDKSQMYDKSAVGIRSAYHSISQSIVDRPSKSKIN